MAFRRPGYVSYVHYNLDHGDHSFVRTPPQSGRATPGIPETFTSVTQLQYDRLTKWANGEFSVGNPLPVYASFDDIPLGLQPAALTKASLEPTIGSPLYPGIEMSWNAELPESYELDSRFTIADKLQPGDLTKYLSLPWQSDFVSATCFTTLCLS